MASRSVSSIYARYRYWQQNYDPQCDYEHPRHPSLLLTLFPQHCRPTTRNLSRRIRISNIDERTNPHNGIHSITKAHISNEPRGRLVRRRFKVGQIFVGDRALFNSESCKRIEPPKCDCETTI